MPALPERKILQFPEAGVTQALIEGEGSGIEGIEPRRVAASGPRLVLRERDQARGDPLAPQALRHEDGFDGEPAPTGPAPQAADHGIGCGRMERDREILDLDPGP